MPKSKAKNPKKTAETTKTDEQQVQQHDRIRAKFFQEKIITEDSDAARDLYNISRFGKIERGKNYLSLIEGQYLLEKEKLEIFDGRNHVLSFEDYLRKAQKIEPNFWIKYCVFRDIRNRGYIIKTALKFGADFRVYERGIKPGEDHAKWVVFPVHEGSTLTWHEFSSKNRVAHSTKKRLLVACVDEEQDVTYWEIKWVRP
ncbi:MAG: tRNA-intron lyase [Nanoarchaeota archaeon]|nr:tRNA-intron lyase [Nanoarchaeota archaeon]